MVRKEEKRRSEFSLSYFYRCYAPISDPFTHELIQLSQVENRKTNNQSILLFKAIELGLLFKNSL